jgi:hypothetical protein
MVKKLSLTVSQVGALLTLCKFYKRWSNCGWVKLFAELDGNGRSLKDVCTL